MDLLHIILLFCLFQLGFSKLIHKRRLTRANTFDPPLPPFPNANTPFAWPAPYPLPAQTTMSPADALLPKPPKYRDSNNPYLEVMSEPINPNYGLGFSAVQPTLIGGGINFPVGNMLRPQENVGGTFGFSRPVNVRFGNQGGPFYAWQDKQFVKTVNQLQDRNAIEDTGNVQRDVPVSSFNRPNIYQHSSGPFGPSFVLPPPLPGSGQS